MLDAKGHMSMQTNLEALIEAAKRLTADDRERFVHALRQQSDSVRQRRITEMRGLGKDLWRSVEAQEYVDAERDSWEN
jgi:hypothetical protein